ncbi:MAG: EamA family transporter [Thermoanaerobaculia bacterium]
MKKEKERVFYFSFFLVVGGNILYHLSQKSIPRGLNPAFSVTVSYIAALALSAALYPLLSDQPFRESARRLNWASVGVGVSAVAIEFGFLLVYRTGWKLSVASPMASATIAVILIPLGIWLYRERLSPVNFLGLFLCLVGLFLAVRR